RFIEEFLKIITPLTQLTLKDQAFMGIGVYNSQISSLYHPSKDNMEVDAISGKTIHIPVMIVKKLELIKKFIYFNLYMEMT
ncbi:hypothetical protein CR513_05129, partial [Mucuna pruriens]